MLIKLPTIIDTKIVYILFRLDKYNDYFILTINDKNDYQKKIINDKNNNINIIKVLCYNNINGIYYINLYVPFKIIYINNYLWTNYFFNLAIVSNFSSKFDFFYELELAIKKKYNYSFIKYDDLKNISEDIWKISNLEYQIYVSNKNISEIYVYLKNLWEYNNLVINMCLFLLFNLPNITIKNSKNYQTKNNIIKKIITIANNIKSLKFKINSSNNYSLIDHLNFHENKNIENINNIIINNNYFIKINELKYILIKINNIDNDIIYSQNIEIKLNNYKLYHYIPNTSIPIRYIFMILLNMRELYSIVLSNIDNTIDTIHHTKILDYYINKPITSNLYYLFNKYIEDTEKIDFEILKLNDYDNVFFKYIVKKYTDVSKIISIIKILFSHYTYPIKFNKFEIETVFDNILYISLYNYKKLIYYNSLKQYSENKILLINDLIQIIPSKVKLFYYNIMKIFYQLFNSSEEYIYNIKYFNDNLYKNFIKIFFYENCNTINLLKEMLDPSIIERNKNNIFNNLLLIDIANKLSWDNLIYKSDYLRILINNENIYYQNKLNKVIFNDSYDNRIKSIILNPFEIFNFLNYESQFTEWISLLNYKIKDIYNNEISLSVNDIIDLGKLIYYLYNIKDQDFNDDYYKLLINHASKNLKIILFNGRINIKIKEKFNIKFNLNFGILAKHLNNYTIDLACTDPKNEIILLQHQLNIVTKKYLKYKKKYIKINTKISTKS
jgi:hypothetical protein